jgi:hypothetical protein
MKLIVGPLVGATVGASLTGFITLVLALFGPGRYWGWRLQKLLDITKNLDAARFRVQRDVLLAEVDSISMRVAAIHRVPTDWAVFILGNFGYGACYGAVIFATTSHPHVAGGLVAKTLFWIGLIALATFGSPTLLWATNSFHYTKWWRRAFIRSRGLPVTFDLPPRPRPGWRPSEWGLTSGPWVEDPRTWRLARDLGDNVVRG